MQGVSADGKFTWFATFNSQFTTSFQQVLAAFAPGGSGSVTNTYAATITVSQASPTAPTLSVSKTHTGTFVQGGTAEWDISVSNAAGAPATNGTTTMSDTLPSGYTVNSFSTTDASWTCTGIGTATATCTSSSAVNGGSSFPVIRIIANIPASSATSVTNTAKAFGGGDTTHTDLATAATGSDTVSVVQVPAFITTTAGTLQSTAVNTSFATNLQVTVQDAGHVGVANIPVTFTAPISGPSGTFGPPCNGRSCVVPTNANGIATAPIFTANGTPGSYLVTARTNLLTAAPFALTNIAPPTITKGFSAATVPLNGIATVSFTITNPNGSTLHGVGFSDSIPSTGGTLLVAPNPNVNNTCGGTVAASPGSNLISLANGVVTTSCTLSVDLRGTVAGAVSNITGPISSSEGGTGNPSNTATIDVTGPPSFTKTMVGPFGAGSLNQGDTAVVTFTISNPNTVMLTGLNFTDGLPSGLSIQNPNGLTDSCDGTVTAVPGSGTITLTGGTLGSVGSCSITVNVTAIAPGNQINPSITLTSNEAPPASSAPASVDVQSWWLWFFY